MLSIPQLIVLDTIFKTRVPLIHFHLWNIVNYNKTKMGKTPFEDTVKCNTFIL